ncbi:FAD-binding domain-containing protein [Xylariaceae sp. FL0016]|nr:FAD-binding domain-containing protein [Xylariaceae sp. FL0016]
MNTTVSSCKEALEAAGLKTTHYPGTSEYDARTQSYFSTSAQLAPACYVQPTSSEEVALAVTTLEQKTSCNWAIRSGGHTVWPGASNIDDGVTIDLGLMNKTTYVPESKTAQIQAGSRWQQVYETLGAYGVTVPGGRTSTVGVGGFLTGGGNTFYTGRRGLGCDNVVNFEVVLATGEIVHANANENPDLFKALKGGSANFGIVTRFDMAVVESNTLWGGLVTYPSSTTDQHIAAYVNWTNNIENYQDGSAILFWSHTPASRDITVTAAYHDTTAAVAAPAFDEFLAVPHQLTNSLRVGTHLDMTNELILTGGYRNVWFAITFKNDPRLYRKALDLQSEFISSWLPLAPSGDFIHHAIFQSIPTLLARHAAARGGNVLGLDRGHDHDNAVMFQVQFAFRGGPDTEAEARRRMVAYRQDLKRHSAALGAAVDWEYLSYADCTQDPLRSYGAENVAFIRRVAARYDPRGVFQSRMPGGFKISKVV